MSDAADRARKCFALAARASTNGERDAAMARGWALIERYGLDPDGFDIPGRERRSPARSLFVEAYTQAAADEAFAQRAREQRWQAVVNAQARGRDRFDVFVNDFA